MIIMAAGKIVGPGTLGTCDKCIPFVSLYVYQA